MEKIDTNSNADCEILTDALFLFLHNSGQNRENFVSDFIMWTRGKKIEKESNLNHVVKLLDSKVVKNVFTKVQRWPFFEETEPLTDEILKIKNRPTMRQKILLAIDDVLW